MRAQFSTIFFVKLGSKQKSLIFRGFCFIQGWKSFRCKLLVFLSTWEPRHNFGNNHFESNPIYRKKKNFLGLLYTWGTVKSNNLSTCKDGEFPEFYTFRSIGHTNFPIWRRKFDGTFPYILIQHKNIFSWIWACWPFHCFDLCSSKWVRGHHHPWHGLESTNLLTKF